MNPPQPASDEVILATSPEFCDIWAILSLLLQDTTILAQSPRLRTHPSKLGLLCGDTELVEFDIRTTGAEIWNNFRTNRRGGNIKLRTAMRAGLTPHEVASLILQRIALPVQPQAAFAFSGPLRVAECALAVGNLLHADGRSGLREAAPALQVAFAADAWLVRTEHSRQQSIPSTPPPA